MLQACMPIKCFRGLQDHCGDYEDLAKPPAPPSPPTSIPPLTSGSVLSADSALSSTGLQDSFVTTHIIDQTGELQLEAAATAKRGYLGWFPTTLLVGMFFLTVFSVHGCWTKALREMQKLVMFCGNLLSEETWTMFGKSWKPSSSFFCLEAASPPLMYLSTHLVP